MAEEIKDEIVLNDDELICVLTGEKKKANAKEQMLQSIILQMNEEYGFEMGDMKRDFTFSFEDDEGKKKRVTVDLAIFRAGAAKEPENLERICVVCDPKVKSSDPRKGVEGALNYALKASSCDFGLWTNGDELHFSQRVEDIVGNERIVDIADFPGIDESIEDMERMGDRSQPRKPANDSLIRTFKRCHDYMWDSYGSIDLLGKYLIISIDRKTFHFKRYNSVLPDNVHLGISLLYFLTFMKQSRSNKI